MAIADVYLCDRCHHGAAVDLVNGTALCRTCLAPSLMSPTAERSNPMHIDLTSILRDFALDPERDPDHVYVTAHLGGIPVQLPVKVGFGVPQVIQDVLVAVAPSIQAGHVDASTVASGLLMAHLTHQAAKSASTPSTAAPAAAVVATVPEVQASTTIAAPAIAPAPEVSAPSSTPTTVSESDDVSPVAEAGGFDSPLH